jgi:hypothetical protein
VQFLLASEPRKPLKLRSLYVIFFVEKDMRVKRRRACEVRSLVSAAVVGNSVRQTRRPSCGTPRGGPGMARARG